MIASLLFGYLKEWDEKKLPISVYGLLYRGFALAGLT
jgi:hypothetical protein